ncbi:MAG: hypothetical protein GYA23_11310, partial [Methanomicrobiales archaeon]|nr:hypothetical protein [Methanomicrobiales archaeon]
LIVLVQIAIVQFGGAVFSTVPLTVEMWLRIILFTTPVLLVGFLLRTVYRLRTARTQSHV